MYIYGDQTGTQASSSHRPHPGRPANQENVRFWRIETKPCYRGTSLIRKRPAPWDPPRTLGIALLQGLRGVRFLVSEVPL